MLSQAVVFTAPNRVEVTFIDTPDPTADDVVVETAHSWISNGTEGSYLRGERIAGDTAHRPGDPAPFPVVAGYQKVGRVTWVGADIHDLAVGDAVFATTGRVNGMFHPQGGQVSPSVNRRDTVWALPADPEPLAFAGMVLTQVGYNCGTRAAMRPGDAAVVLGDGLVGQWAAQTLGLRGARVMMVGRHADRLARFPASHVGYRCHERDEDWLGTVNARFPAGVDVVVDTVGSLEHLTGIMALMVRGGQIVSAGFHGTHDRLSLQDLRDREISVHSVSGWTRPRMDRTLHLIETGQLETLPLITHHFPVGEAPAAWRLIESKSEPVLGVILDWS